MEHQNKERAAELVNIGVITIDYSSPQLSLMVENKSIILSDEVFGIHKYEKYL